MKSRINLEGNFMEMEERMLRAKRAKAVTDARVILDKCEKEKRAMNESEAAAYEKLDNEIDLFNKELSLYEKDSRSGGQRIDDEIRSTIFSNDVLHQGPRFGNNNELMHDARYQSHEHQEAFRNYLRFGHNAIGADHFRALQADSDTAGGFLVMPVVMANRIIQAMDNEVFIRKLATVIPCPKAESLGAPSLDNDPGDPTWTAEIKTGDEDNTMSLGKRELTPHPIARLIKVSNKLVRASFLDPEKIVTDRLVYKFSVVQENAFLNGTGNNQPMGVFTAATAGFGISTARDVSTGNTATAITTDGLIEAFYSLKAQYRKKATWIFHRDAIKKIRKLKDGEGNYIWNLGISADKPATILGAPYCESEYAPSTFNTQLYVGIVADFSHYWIADALSMQIQRLVELYAATNQVGFIGRMELDGMPTVEEAFSRVKLA